MKKEIHRKNLLYIFEPERKGAKYSIDGGEHFMNHGELCEVLAKSVLGYEPKKDANTRHDKGHDIPELNASVKSHKCGLTDRKDLRTGDKWEYFNEFFATEKPNTIYIWVYEYGDFVNLWYMNRNEFREFVLNCAKWDGSKGQNKWRFNICDNTVNQYLESKLCAA